MLISWGLMVLRAHRTSQFLCERLLALTILIQGQESLLDDWIFLDCEKIVLNCAISCCSSANHSNHYSYTSSNEIFQHDQSFQGELYGLTWWVMVTEESPVFFAHGYLPSFLSSFRHISSTKCAYQSSVVDQLIGTRSRGIWLGGRSICVSE